MQDIKTPYDMILILPKEVQAAIKPFLRLGEALRCKSEIRYAHCNKYWRCVFKLRKPAKVLFVLECTETWWRIKAVLSGLSQYTDTLALCSDSIIDKIITAYDCHRCNTHCKGAPPYTFRAKEYRKCIGCSYYFRDLSEQDWGDLERLIREDAKALQG